MLLMKPGYVAPAVDLDSFLREAHERDRASTIARIEKMKAEGNPDEEVKDPGPYEANPRIEGVKVRFRAVENGEVLAAFSAYRELPEDATVEQRARARREEHAANKAFVLSAVAEVQTPTPMVYQDGTSANNVDGWDLAGFLPSLYSAALTFHALPEDERKKLSGSAAMTSASTSATAAGPTSA